MKKTVKPVFALFLAALLLAGCTSTSSMEREIEAIPGVPPLICAALADNYSAFLYFLDRYDGSAAGWTSADGLTVPIAIGYFSLSNFKKACNLLANKGYNLDEPDYYNRSLLSYLAAGCEYEKIRYLLRFSPDVQRAETITGLKPMDYLQYAAYPFTTTGTVTAEDLARRDETRQLLLSAGSPDIKFTNFTLNSYGNFVFALLNVLSTLNPSVTYADVNGPFFDTQSIDGREVYLYKTEALPTIFKQNGVTARVLVVHDEFDSVMQQMAESENCCYLLGDMGNSPFVTHNWVNIDNPYAGNLYMKTSDPDMRTGSLIYRIQDIRQLMVVELLEQ